MKKLIVIFASCCLVLNIIGYHIIFYFRQVAIKTEMMHVIRTQRHTLEESDFVFSPENKNGMAKIEWEGDNEFCLNGEMYDVIERRTAGDKILIRCLADKKETDLLNKMSDSWKENDKSNKIAHDLFNILQGLFHQSLSDQICVDGAIGKQTAWLVLTLPPGIRRIPSQPPQS